VSDLYPDGIAAFFSEWLKFTESATPVVVNRAPQLLLIARGMHSRTKDAMRFLADNGLPVTVVPVSLYEDDAGRRLVDIERESEVTSGGPSEQRLSGSKSQKTYTIDGHLVRIVDLVEEGLLPAGTEIELSTRGKAALGVVTEDGTIKIGETSTRLRRRLGRPW
jgi:hypothetical protein